MIVAQEWINKNGGINGRPLKIIFEDFGNSAKNAADAANKLINIDNVNLLMASTGTTASFSR